MKKWFDTPKVIIRIKGEPFNPLKNDESESSIFTESVMQNLLNYETAGTIYSYNHGYNEITSFSTKERKPIKIPGGSMTITILAAVAFSFILQYLPSGAQVFFTQFCIPSLLKSFMGVIIAITGPFIFISIVSGILSIDNIDTVNSVGTKIISRFIGISLVTAIVTTIISEMFYSVITFESDADFTLNEVVELFVSVIPTNLFKPFIEGTILQIVIIAFFISFCILNLEKFTPNVRMIVSELDRIVKKMFYLTSKIMTATIFLCIVDTITRVELKNILDTWSIIVITYAIYIIICAWLLIRLAVKNKITVKEFLNKIWEAAFISMTTGSNSASIQKNFEVAVNEFKIDEKFVNFWLPLSHSILRPGSTQALLLAVFYAAHISGETISVIELLVAIFLSLQLSIATPPSSGGLFPIFACILQQMNLPLDAIGPLIIAGVFCINIPAAMSIIIKNCELIDIAYKLNYIDNTEGKNGSTFA